MDKLIDDAAPEGPPQSVNGQLAEVCDFGANPGNLAMRVYVPANPSHRRPLVVVLHGCRQTAEGYDLASGWSRLAELHDFILLYPEQQETNNSRRCFNWFEPADMQRGGGEAESIRQMISAALATFHADPDHVYICGLSAGGAMACAMLAAYPEIFRAGAIIAGLPYGAASNVSEAYECMSTGKVKEAKVWGDLVRSASEGRDRWPDIAIWHGVEDNVVKPINAGELVKQWTNVHGLGATLPDESHVGRIARRRAWCDAASRPRVTEYSVPGLRHGAPLDDRDAPAPFFVPAGISSTWHIANDWRLTKRSKPKSIKALFGLSPGPMASRGEQQRAGVPAQRP